MKTFKGSEKQITEAHLVVTTDGKVLKSRFNELLQPGVKVLVVKEK